MAYLGKSFHSLSLIVCTDDAFSTETGLERAGIAGPVHCLWNVGLLCKNKKQKGSARARPLPL